MSADDHPPYYGTKALHGAGKSRNGLRESFDRHSRPAPPECDGFALEPFAGVTVLPASAVPRTLDERQGRRRSIHHVLVERISGCRKPHHADGRQRNAGTTLWPFSPTPTRRLHRCPRRRRSPTRSRCASRIRSDCRTRPLSPIRMKTTCHPSTRRSSAAPIGASSLPPSAPSSTRS